MSGNGDSPIAAALFEAANKLRSSIKSADYKHARRGIGDEIDLGQGESVRAVAEGHGDIL